MLTKHFNYNSPEFNFHLQEDCTNQWVSFQLSLNIHWLEKSVCSPGNHGGQTKVKDGQPLGHSAFSTENHKKNHLKVMHTNCKTR